MPSSLKTFEEFDQLLGVARAEVDAMLLKEPGDGAIAVHKDGTPYPESKTGA